MINLFETAIDHRHSGRLKEALAIYYRVLKKSPNDPVANHMFGVVACQIERDDVGISMILKAIKIKPDYAEAYGDLGNVYALQGKLKEAAASFRKAIALRPGLIEAHNNLGNLLKEQGFLSRAYDSYRRAVEINPNFYEAHSNMLLIMNYCPDRHDEIYSESIKWNRQHVEEK